MSTTTISRHLPCYQCGSQSFAAASSFDSYDSYSSLLPTPSPSPTTPTQRARPIPNSYWATPSLLACEFPYDPREQYNPKIDALLKSGVRTFIDLTERGELEAYDTLLDTRAALLGIDPSSVEYHCFPIRDRCLPESVQLVHRVMRVLEDAETRGRVAAIHCRGGVGRTGTLVGCWLVYSRIAKDGREALDIVDLLWKTVPKSKRFVKSPETGAQYEFVLKFRRDAPPPPPPPGATGVGVGRMLGEAPSAEFTVAPVA